MSLLKMTKNNTFLILSFRFILSIYKTWHARSNIPPILARVAINHKGTICKRFCAERKLTALFAKTNKIQSHTNTLMRK